jgi:hypothetical protein
MPSDSEFERSDPGATHVEAPVEKYLRLAATTDDLLRTDSGQSPGAFVMLNVGGITAAERDEPEPSDE